MTANLAGAAIKAFLADEAFWKGAWTDDVLIKVDGVSREGLYDDEISDDQQIEIVSGDVYNQDGLICELKPFLAKWQASQAYEFVTVRVLKSDVDAFKCLIASAGLQIEGSAPAAAAKQEHGPDFAGTQT